MQYVNKLNKRNLHSNMVLLKEIQAACNQGASKGFTFQYGSIKGD